MSAALYERYLKARKEPVSDDVFEGLDSSALEDDELILLKLYRLFCHDLKSSLNVVWRYSLLTDAVQAKLFSAEQLEDLLKVESPNGWTYLRYEVKHLSDTNIKNIYCPQLSQQPS